MSVPSNEGILLIARVHLISSTTVLGAIYGSTFGLYILCARSLYLRLKNPDLRRQNIISLIYMSLIMTCGLLEIAANAVEIQTSYVDNADYPGGGFAYAMEVFSKLPMSTMAYTISLLLDALTFGFQIWRMRVIWEISQYSFLIVVPPTLALLAYIATRIAATAILGQSIDESVLVQNPIIHASKALQLFVTVFVTVFIIAKLVMVRRRHLESMGQSETSSLYTAIISMLIESFALETIWIAVSVGLRFSSALAVGAATMFFLRTQSFIQILSYLLVVYRVTKGRGWKKDIEEKPPVQEVPRTAHLSTRASIPIEA